MKTIIKNAVTGIFLASSVFFASAPGIGQTGFASNNPEDGMSDVDTAEEYYDSQKFLPEDHRSDILVYRDAEFFGGMNRMEKFLRENFEYPAYAKDNGIEGSMTVRFDIDERGNITNVEVIKGLHKSLDNELKRTIESMPVWVPALKAGFPVRSTVELPFKATLL